MDNQIRGWFVHIFTETRLHHNMPDQAVAPNGKWDIRMQWCLVLTVLRLMDSFYMMWNFQCEDVNCINIFTSIQMQ